MKNIIKSILIISGLFLVVTFSSCKREVLFNFIDEQISIRVEEQVEVKLNLDESINKDLITYSSNDEEIVKFSEGIITGINPGTTLITITYQYEDEMLKDEIMVLVGFSSKEEGYLSIAQDIDALIESLPTVTTKSDYEFILKIKDDYEVLSSDIKKYVTKLDLLIEKVQEAEKIFMPEIIVEIKEVTITLGETFNIHDLGIELVNVWHNKEGFSYKFEESVITIENDVIQGISEGVTILTLALKHYEQYEGVQIKVIVEKDQIAPIIICDSQVNKISWNETFDPYEGMIVIDDKDQNVELKLISDFSNRNIGTQTLVYEAIDFSGNKTTYQRIVEVVWDYSVTFIGHAGSYYGVMNTEEAFLYAADKLHYQALECDLRQTKDGVFVLCHDETFGGKEISNTNWEDLKDVYEEKTRNSGYPSKNGSVKNGGVYKSTICTLERYFEICKEYGIKAVIELKYSYGINNDSQSRMSALMEFIKEHDMLDNVIFLGSQYKCLIWVRENGYSNIPCQYLVNSCESEATLNRCIEYGFDVSINATDTKYKNSAEWIKKYQDAGCKVSTYTFTQWVSYQDLQKWIDLGVDYVTCDWHVMSNVKLPK